MSRSLQSENLQQLSNCLVSKSLSTREVSCELGEQLDFAGEDNVHICSLSLCYNWYVGTHFVAIARVVCLLVPLTKGFLQLRSSQK